MEATKIAPCCNCCQPFTLLVVNNTIKGRFPHSLCCGHPVCETCIFTMLRSSSTIKCHQCQTTSDFAETEVKKIKEDPETFMSYFPINFYLFGILCFNFYKEPVNPNRNINLFPAGASTQNINSRFKYKQRTYFTSFPPNVHQKSNYGIEKFFISLSKCSEHPEKNLELFCSDCSKTICTLCLVKTCSNHKFNLIQEKNEEFSEIIKAKSQEIKELLLRVKKTALDLEKRCSITSLGTVDSKSAEAALAEHFGRSHGALQKAESSLAAKIKSNKNYLSNLVTNLHNTAKNLTDLIEVSETALLPPNLEKMNLADISSELIKAANTPWYFEEDVNVMRPNISLEVDTEIFNNIENHCKVKSDTENLKLLSTSELPSYVELPPITDDAVETASVKSSGSSHSNQSKVSSVKSAPYKDLNFDLKVKYENFLKNTNTGQNSQSGFVNNAANKQEKFVRPLIAGMVENVFVTNIENPHDFYVQRKIMVPKLHEMSNTYHSMRNTLVKPTHEDMSKESMFVIFDAEQCRWDRVRKINHPDKEKDEYSVKYIDYGHTLNVSINRLRIAPKEPFYPVFSLRCSLVECQPIHGKWTDESNLLMLKIIERSNSECYLNVIRVSNDLLEVDLITRPAPEELCTSITEALIYLEYACLGNPKNQVNKYNNPIKTTKEYFTKPRLGDMQQVIVTNIIDPNAFFVRKENLEQYFENLSTDLNSVYKITNSAGSIYTPKEGMCVACCVNKKWWRAQILSLLPKGQLEVILVDTGIKHQVDWKCIRKLQPKFFKIDELASICKLGNIKPIGNTWCPEAIKFMNLLLKNRPVCNIKLLKPFKRYTKKNAVESVLLYLTTEGDENICLNNELVKNDLACSTCVTKQVNIVKPQVSAVEPDEEASTSGSLKLMVKILSTKSPSEVYISIKSSEDDLHELYKKMDKFYLNTEPNENANWKASEKCAVLSPDNNKWCRAIIESVNRESNKIKVFLKDHARVNEVDATKLRPLEQQFLKVRDGALKCHLSGIIPASGEKWPMLTCETLQDIVQQYDRFYITKDGEISNKSLPIELWVYHTTPGGALTPTIKEWKKVNDRIVEEGLAIPDRSKPAPVSVVPALEEPPAYVSQLCDDFTPPVAYEDWLPAAPLKSRDFTGMPTNVDDELNIYLYDQLESGTTLELLSNTLTSHFKNSKPKPYDMFWYPGQICITKYNVDDRFYRARVLKILENNQALVIFVDYGNIQECPISMLRKDIVCHHIPIQSHKCKLHNIQPVEGDTWNQNIGDFFHQNIVEKECTILVVGEAQNGVTPIELKINKINDLSELMLSFRYAVPKVITQQKTEEQACNNNEDDDVVEDSDTKNLPNFPEDKIDWNQLIQDAEKK